MLRRLFLGKRKYIFTATAVFLFLGMVEGGARLILRLHVLKIYGADIAAFREADLIPDLKKGWQWEGGRTFRGRADVPREKPPGLYRIITTGDSCCWGALVPTAATYSAKLEAMLRGRYGEDRVEVLNGGVVGYGTRQVISHIRETLAAYHPDMIIQYGNVEESNRWTRRFDPDALRRYERLNAAFFYCKAFQLMHDALLGRNRPSGQAGWIVESPVLSELIKLVRSLPAQIVLMEYPVVADGVIRSDLGDFTIRTDAPVVRTCPALTESGYSTKKLIFDHVHPTPLGHTIIARCVFDEIVGNQWME